jgi:hypothetical protein
MSPEPTAADLPARVAKLQYKLDRLSVGLGEQRMLDYSTRDQRLPGPRDVVTGFAYGIKHDDLALYYREIVLTQPSDEEAAAHAGVSPGSDLAESIHQLERLIGGLRIQLDQNDKWRDYVKPFLNKKHIVPDGAANVLAGVVEGLDHGDAAIYYGQLIVLKTPRRQRPFAGSLEERVVYMEGQLSAIHPVHGPREIMIPWTVVPGSAVSRVMMLDYIVTGIGHPGRERGVIARRLELAFD